MNAHEPDKIFTLRELLITWRRCEKEWARAVLAANHPDHIRALSDASEIALHRVRQFVDKEPWGERA